MLRRDFVRGSSAALAALAAARRVGATPRGFRPRSSLARPSAPQLAWQRRERALFLHFGVNTFTGREWGDGTEDARLFAPQNLDARQWVRAAKSAGFASLVLTAKHHDGFCLWPSAFTTHSVKSSPWKGGAGDVVREFTDACRAEGVGAGLYLSPWDRHEPSYGDSARYNDYYERQLTELLTHYGPLTEVWFDGANGEGPNGKRQVYDWPRVHATVRRLQPKALMFSDAGPDIRWMGNEAGVAGDPNWCAMDPAAVPYPGADGPQIIDALQHGDPRGTVWRPGEADVSIRPGWFWRESEDEKVRTADDLEALYFSSVGRNANLLLNVPPTTNGTLGDRDVRALAEFGERIARMYASDVALGATVSSNAPSARAHRAAMAIDPDPDTFFTPLHDAGEATIELRFDAPVTFDVVSLQEAIGEGQCIGSHEVQARLAGAMQVVASGTTVGHRRLHRLAASVTTDRLVVTARSTIGPVRISRLSLYRHD
ncbi:MAG: alpha-L-fucosidase [Gemmatimonadetes bacterium]|nr:alpha-L-fucosidase [Gemmatimonadota bacterium]